MYLNILNEYDYEYFGFHIHSYSALLLARRETISA